MVDIQGSPLVDIYGIGGEIIAATQEWEYVTDLREGGFDWAQINVYWSPSARRYFWYEDSGCSCSSWGDSIFSLGDFSDGDRIAARNALREFAEDNPSYTSNVDLAEALLDLANFKEPTNG